MANAGETSEVKDDDDATSGHYCGIYSLYAGLNTLGIRAEIGDLITPRYVGSRAGSSLAELQRGAEDHGAYAVAMQGLSIDSLRVSPYPMILHVKSPRLTRLYNHWVLYLGVQDGKARILDAPRHVELIPFADVLARWDGTALIVSDRPVDRGPFVWTARARYLALALFAVAAIVSVRCVAAKRAVSQSGGGRHIMRRIAIHASGLLCLSAGLALGWHALSTVGFFRNPRAVGAVAATYHATFLPRLSADELRSLLAEDDVVLIDARRARDYRLGHIKGAINVPVTASLSLRERALEGIARSALIVVYCQSHGCSYDEEVANLLSFHGYDNVMLFPDGWAGWTKQRNTTK